MDLLPSIPSDTPVLPEGCQQLGSIGSSPLNAQSLHPWSTRDQPVDLLLVLAARRTAEHEGISAAGSTALSEESSFLHRTVRRLSSVGISPLQLPPRLSLGGAPLPAPPPPLRLTAVSG